MGVKVPVELVVKLTVPVAEEGVTVAVQVVPVPTVTLLGAQNIAVVELVA